MRYIKFLFFFLLIFSLTISSKAQEKKQENNVPQSQLQDNLKLEKNFPGPFRDTIIQRWVDQKNGVVCYLYIPLIAEAARAGTENTPRVYGANNIGSISCLKK